MAVNSGMQPQGLDHAPHRSIFEALDIGSHSAMLQLGKYDDKNLKTERTKIFFASCFSSKQDLKQIIKS